MAQAKKKNTKTKKTTGTESKARQKAREQAIKNHSDVVIHGENGKIRARDSYGNDPYPPKG